MSFFSLLLLALTGSPSPEGDAPATPVSVDWDAPAGPCPSSEAVNERLRERIGTAEHDRVAVRVVEEAGAWQATVEGPEPRTLTAPTCAELADAVVVLVELSRRDPPEPDASPAPTPVAEPVTPTAEPPPAGPSVRTTARPPTRSSTWSLAAAVDLLLLQTPSPAPGFEVLTGVRGRRWALHLGLVGRPGFSGAPTPVAGVESRFATWSGLVRGCGVPGHRRVDFPICAGAELGGITGIAGGTAVAPSRSTAPWILARAEVGLRVRAHPRLSPYARVGGTLLVARPSFSIEGAGRVCCREPAGLTAVIGLEIPLPTKTGPS